MRYLFFLVVMVACYAQTIKGQQDPQFSQLVNNQMIVNPGFAGSSDQICLTGNMRQQWVGMPGSPTTSAFAVNAPFNLFGISSGVGATIFNDQLGFDNNLSFNVSYAYQMNLRTGKLGIGVSGGMLNKSLSDAEWNPTDGNLNDDLIPQGNESAFVFDLGLGIYYSNEDLFIGVSTTHLNEPVIQYENATPYINRHYYITAGYRIQLPNPLIELHPSAYIMSDGNVNQLTMNTKILYNKRFWGGVSYRAGSAIIGLLGVELFNGLKVSYSYDFATSNITRYSSGSHEILIGYCFSIKVDKEPQKYKSIRFL